MTRDAVLVAGGREEKRPVRAAVARRARKRQADADHRPGSRERETVLLELKKDIEQRWNSYDISRRTILHYPRSMHGRAEELVRLTREGYLLGEIDLLALPDARRTFVASEVRYLDTLRAYHLDWSGRACRELLSGGFAARATSRWASSRRWAWPRSRVSEA